MSSWKYVRGRLWQWHEGESYRGEWTGYKEGGREGWSVKKGQVFWRGRMRG